MKSIFRIIPLALALIVVVSACATISPFNEYAYQQATSLKVDALTLIDKADEPYSQHQAEVADLETRIEKAYEYANGLPKNEDTIAQWSIIKDPTRHSLFGLFQYWKTKGTLSETFIDDEKGEIADDFDAIIGLESGKRKSK